jgi:TetR/AcrR family transcriptional regulator
MPVANAMISQGNAGHHTNERILRAAHSLFSTLGFAATKMETVAQSAGISRQTLYGYYRRKEELYEAVLTREGAILREKTSELHLDCDEVEALRQVIHLLFDEFVGGANHAITDVRMHKGIHVPRIALAMGATHRAILDQVLARGQANGRFTADIDCALFQATIIALLNGFASSKDVLQLLTGTDTTSSEAIARWRDHLANTLIRSILRP